MKSINYLIMLLFTLLVMAGCSGSDGADSTPTSQSQISVDPGSYSLQLSVPTFPSGTLLTSGGKVTVRAYISYTSTDDRYGVVKRYPVADGTLVNFFVIDTAGSSRDDAISTAGTIESLKTTVNGYAEATYSAGDYAGMVKIYAANVDNTFGDGGSTLLIEDTYTFEVASGVPDPGSYSLELSAPTLTPGALLPHGGQVTVRAYIFYTSTDSYGVVRRSPVADGTGVNFFVIDAAGSGRDDAISTAGTINSPTKTVNGYADATYSAGNYGGMVKIYADIDNNSVGDDLSYVSGSYSFEVAPGKPDPGSYSLQLSTSTLTPGTLLSHGGQVTVRAYISYTTTDTAGVVTRLPAADGTLVNFFVIDAAGSSSSDAILYAGTIESLKATVNGYADATYSADNYGGMVKIYAVTDNNWGDGLYYYEDTYSFKVASGEPVAINVGSIAPATINVTDTGKINTSILTFSLTDNAGNPVPDLSSVAFTFSTPLGGGEKLSKTEAGTQNGQVSVSLISGTVSGTVGVNASYFDAKTGVTLSTEAKVTIVSGPPVAERLGIAVQYRNLAGGRTFGLQDDITVYLGDRYGNVVPDGTAVSFMSECGTIGTSAGFQSTTTRGVAHASLQTSAPTVPYLGGVIGSAPGNPGLCRIVAYTPGAEGFNDINGNNVYDEGTDVQTIDMSEPYIDANEYIDTNYNGKYDIGEKYIDVDGNGSFTQADGKYQSKTMIWTSVNVLMSDEQGPLNLQTDPPNNTDPKTFTIDAGGSPKFFTYWLGDVYGNSLVAGTTAKVTATGGTLSGDVDITVADSLGEGQQHSFKLTVPANTSATSIEVTVEVTPPPDPMFGTPPPTGINSDISVIEKVSGTVTVVPTP